MREYCHLRVNMLNPSTPPPQPLCPRPRRAFLPRATEPSQVQNQIKHGTFGAALLDRLSSPLKSWIGACRTSLALASLPLGSNTRRGRGLVLSPSLPQHPGLPWFESRRQSWSRRSACARLSRRRPGPCGFPSNLLWGQIDWLRGCPGACKHNLASKLRSVTRGRSERRARVPPRPTPSCFGRRYRWLRRGRLRVRPAESTFVDPDPEAVSKGTTDLSKLQTNRV